MKDFIKEQKSQENSKKDSNLENSKLSEGLVSDIFPQPIHHKLNHLLINSLIS